MVVGTTLCTFEIHFVRVRSRCFPSVCERVFLLCIGSSRSKDLLVAVPILKDEVVSLTVGKLCLHFDAIGRIVASVRLYGSGSSRDQRLVRSREVHVECVAIRCIIEPQVVLMRLSVRYQTIDLDKVGSFRHLRNVGIGFRHVCATIYVGKDVVATLVGVSNVETQGVGRHIARMDI